MKIYFNRPLKREPWGGGAHFHSAMADFLTKKGHTVVDKLTHSGVDLVFMLDPRYSPGSADANYIFQYKYFNKSTKILHRVNECDARKNTNNIDNILLHTMQFTDRTVFISEWLQSYFHRKGFIKDSNVINNGCNENWFYPEENKKLKSKISIVTHHWSDNYMKGFDLYNFLDKFIENNDKFSFTYIGRYNKDYIPKNTKIIPPMYGKELGNELRKHDIYVTASKFEPCGMHHIEGAASGLPVLYHNDGGAIVDICKNHGLGFSNNNEFVNVLSEAICNYNVLRDKINYKNLDIEHCCNQYYEIIKEMLDIK